MRQRYTKELILSNVKIVQRSSKLQKDLVFTGLRFMVKKDHSHVMFVEADFSRLKYLRGTEGCTQGRNLTRASSAERVKAPRKP